LLAKKKEQEDEEKVRKAVLGENVCDGENTGGATESCLKQG